MSEKKDIHLESERVGNQIAAMAIRTTDGDGEFTLELGAMIEELAREEAERDAK